MSSSGWAVATRRHSSSVSSFECPSTKMSSVWEPSAGSRRTTCSMLPFSFRHGQTTVTLGGPGEARGIGLATTQLVHTNQRATGRCARKRLAQRLTGPSLNGRRMCPRERTVSKPASRSRFSTSPTVVQLRSGSGYLRPRASSRCTTGCQTRLYQLMTMRVPGCETARSRSSASLMSKR